MDSKIQIPGLGQFSNAEIPPAPPSDAIPSGAATVEALSEQQLPNAEHKAVDDLAQMNGTPANNDQTQAMPLQNNFVTITEPIAETQPSDAPSEQVSIQHEREDVNMEDGQVTNTITTEEVAAHVVPEAQDSEMSGTAVQQQAIEAESPPASPPVTHELEAALVGLLGPIEDETPNDIAPTNGEPANPQVSNDTTTAVQLSTSATVVPTEGGAAPVEEEADANPEWEADSSPYESSSSDSSDDSSDDDSDVEESKHSIEETARLLMEADGGSDEEIDGARAAKQAATVRTKNEQPDQPEPKPEIIIDATDKVLPLGIVQHIVEGTHVVIEALAVGGAPTILDRGTVLCKEDRTVLGVIHDTIATVHKPMYILKCQNEEELKNAGVERGTQIWYAEAHAVVVFPSQLKAQKGSDASNLYDEEVGPEEVEYSDDEQEQAHKREKKNKKQRGKGGRGNKFARGDENGSRISANGDTDLHYGDDDDDGPYKPLSRPANFGMGLPPPPPPPAGHFPHSVQGNRGGHDQGRRGDSRGRGGRGARGRGFNGRGRGGHNQSSPLSTPQAPNSYLPPPPFAANAPPMPPMPGQWPYPIPPVPHFGGAAPSNPNTPTPSFPMPNWGAGQPSPFPFVPVPPPNWPNAAQRAPQQTNYTPPTSGYNMPTVPYPPNGAGSAPVPPPPPPNYQQQQYQQNYYGNGQPPNGQPQQRWG